jgi:hypothetical protein
MSTKPFLDKSKYHKFYDLSGDIIHDLMLICEAIRQDFNFGLFLSVLLGKNNIVQPDPLLVSQTLANEKEYAPLEHNPGAYSMGK